MSLRWAVDVANWAFLAVFLVVGLSTVLNRDPESLRRNFRNLGSRGWLIEIAGALLCVGIISVALLDAGVWKVALIPLWARVLGVVVYVAAGAFRYWVTASNPFFTTAMQLQVDRGHYVVDTGPYSLVRHPGYLGSTLMVLGVGLGLGSWLSVAGTLLLSIWTIRRTVIEDRFLVKTLAGYREYVKAVRWRLVPGIW